MHDHNDSLAKFYVLLESWSSLVSTCNKKNSSVSAYHYTDRLSIKKKNNIIKVMDEVLKCCVTAGNRCKLLGKSHYWQHQSTRNTGNATSWHGNSTLATGAPVSAFVVLISIILTMKQVFNITYEQASSPASCVVPYVVICGKKCF